MPKERLAKKIRVRRSNGPVVGDGDTALLAKIPGIGPKCLEDFTKLQIYSVSDLAVADPEEMFNRLRASVQPPSMDRCVLYVFRSTVYAARKYGDEIQSWKSKSAPLKSDPWLAWSKWSDANISPAQEEFLKIKVKLEL